MNRRSLLKLLASIPVVAAFRSLPAQPMTHLEGQMRISFWIAVWLLTLGAARIYVEYSDGLVIDLKGWLE